jgi:hypothetical protein
LRVGRADIDIVKRKRIRFRRRDCGWRDGERGESLAGDCRRSFVCRSRAYQS